MLKYQFQTQLRLFAHYYYSMGFNITCISNLENDYNYFNPAPLKAPNHKWEHLINSRQTIDEVSSYSWENSTGLGCVLGNSNYRCIDIDGITDISIISDILSALYLPEDYEWVCLTGSGKGVHIYIEAEQHKFIINNGQIKAFFPSQNNRNKFKRLELRWKYHCVLPPSLHSSYNYYEFKNNQLPKTKPSKVVLNDLYQMVNRYCDYDGDMKVKIKYDNYENKQSKIYFLNTGKPSFYDNGIDKTKAKERKFIVFDTETNGLPHDWNTAPDNSENWPNLIQIGWYIFGENANFISKSQYLIEPNGFTIKPKVTELTGITQNEARQKGVRLKEALALFKLALDECDYVVAHNLEFDSNVLISETLRMSIDHIDLLPHRVNVNKRMIIKVSDLNFDFRSNGICTMKESVSFCNLTKLKYPKLEELYVKLFNKEINAEHNALEDSKITALCFWELLWREIVKIKD
ncbi:exonuclease domain-containing protein [Algibacter sp.]|nr:exonuclease domain-containing protein [Algibacter sp.]